MRFVLLVFDWDGTLMDSEAKIVASVQAALSDLQHPGLEPLRVREIIGLGLQEAVEALLPGRDQAFYERFIDRYRHHFLGADRTPMPLFADTESTLKQLHGRGYRLAVATGKSRRGLDRVLRETGLAGLFESSRCADETASKPDPQMLREIMEELGVAPARTLMVGDTDYDLEMAQRAGVTSAAVTYGVHGYDRLLKFAPAACLDRLSQLPQWLEYNDGKTGKG